ncbi:MAG: ribonuclease HII [Candidatus Hydrogenedentes bacterium]|nr:ribonuclease HII [Candidatus Hydrogenedentota bacterium]
MSPEVSREPLSKLVARAKGLEPPFPAEFMAELAADSRAGARRLLATLRRREQAYRDEMDRLAGMLRFERQAAADGAAIVAGVDEAGRGPIAGPVTAAAVVLPEDVTFAAGLNDSKRLSAGRRDSLFAAIMASSSDVGWGIVSHRVVDQIGIQSANFMAMRLAVEGLGSQPDCLLVDGYAIRDSMIPCIPIIKGDSKSLSIAAASVVAKVTRDRIMTVLDRVFPQYGFSRHKGYGTRSHYEAIERYGLSPVHRKSFFRAFDQQTLPFLDTDQTETVNLRVMP